MNIAEGIAWLAEQKFAADAVTVTYARGATELSISAVRGRTAWESDDETADITRMQSADYLVAASDLAALETPQAGDQITDGALVFEVMSPDGEHPWQWADWPNRTVYRVHAKQVGESS